MKRFSERRLKENEVIFKQAHQSIADFLTEDSGNGDTIIKFYCECSNLNCRRRIPLRAADYDKLHRTQRQFIILKGHELPDIEKVTKEYDSFSVVEKVGEMPSVADIRASLPSIAASL